MSLFAHVVLSKWLVPDFQLFLLKNFHPPLNSLLGACIELLSPSRGDCFACAHLSLYFCVV